MKAKNIKHYRIEPNSNYMRSICEHIEAFRCVKTIKTIDEEYIIYDFYIDANEFYSPLITIDFLNDYEIVELTKKQYMLMKEDLDRYLDFKSDVNKEKEKILSEYNESIEKQRKELFEKTLKEAEDEIETRANNKYLELMRIFKDSPEYDDIYEMFKDKIEIEVQLRLEEILERTKRYFIDDLNSEYNIGISKYNYIRNMVISALNSSIYERYKINSFCSSETMKFIHKFKNDIVDSIAYAIDLENKRGTKEYWVISKRLGKIADILEKTFFDLYAFYHDSKRNVKASLDEIKNINKENQEKINNLYFI